MIRKMPIKQKKKKCVICGEETYIFSKHRCKSCTMKQDAKPIVRSTTSIKRKPKPKNKNLETFFEKHIEILYKFKYSEESNRMIPYPTKVNICHLFPKRNHKSVESHEMNCIYLTWEEHTLLDTKYLDRLDFTGLEKAFPNSWKLMVERMRVVRASITERTNFVEAFDKFNEALEF
jgi:hypothetical protein